MAGQPFTKAMQVGPPRKKYRRTVASRKTWEKLRDERLSACVCCVRLGHEQKTPSELHHAIPRDRGGDDVAENLVPLCRQHHELVERGEEATLLILAWAIQQDEPAVYAHMVDRLGEDGYLRHFRVRFSGGEAA